MNRQLRINRPQRQRQRQDEAAPLVLPQPDEEQTTLDEADDIVLQIVAERVGDRTRHERADAIDDERIYNENQQKGGQ